MENKKLEAFVQGITFEDFETGWKNYRAKRMGDWKILKDGTLENQKNDYYIEKHRLGQPHWITHMMEKNWIDKTFFYAYFEACRNAGINHLTIRLT